jgi:hypothetical protein
MVEPVFPVNVMVVELPEHNSAAVAVAIPPTDAGETVTVAVALYETHEPIVITALYEVVAVKLVAVKVVDVLAIGVPAVAKLFNVDSQRVIVPVCPLKVNTVLFVPEQTVALPAIEPPTDAGKIVIVPVANTVPQPPVNGML